MSRIRLMYLFYQLLIAGCFISHFGLPWFSLVLAPEERQHTQHRAEEGNTFNQRRTNDHGSLDLVGCLRLTRYPRHRLTCNTTYPKASTDHN